jgi:hypothetical protein
MKAVQMLNFKNWKQWHIAKGDEEITCTYCKRDFDMDDVVVFDSIVEHKRGLELKILEAQNEIKDLKHHVVIETKASDFAIGIVKLDPRILKNLYLEKILDDDNYFLCDFKIVYESDFCYESKFVNIVEEVKRLNKKRMYPYFVSRAAEILFLKKCQVFERIGDPIQAIQVVADGYIFTPDKNFKKFVLKTKSK